MSKYVNEIKKDLYDNVEKQISLGNKLLDYRKGTLVLKKRNNEEYYYLSYRDRNKVKTDYLGKLDKKDVARIKSEIEESLKIKNTLKSLRAEEESLRKFLKAIDPDSLKEDVYEVIDIIVIIRPILKAFGIKEAYLFGSYARDEANTYSDINLLIDHNNGSIEELIKRLEKATDKSIDILTSQTVVPSNIRENIDDEKILIYGGY